MRSGFVKLWKTPSCDPVLTIRGHEDRRRVRWSQVINALVLRFQIERPRCHVCMAGLKWMLVRVCDENHSSACGGRSLIRIRVLCGRLDQEYSRFMWTPNHAVKHRAWVCQVQQHCVAPTVQRYTSFWGRGAEKSSSKDLKGKQTRADSCALIVSSRCGVAQCCKRVFYTLLEPSCSHRND